MMPAWEIVVIVNVSMASEISVAESATAGLKNSIVFSLFFPHLLSWSFLGCLTLSTLKRHFRDIGASQPIATHSKAAFKTVAIGV